MVKKITNPVIARLLAFVKFSHFNRFFTGFVTICIAGIALYAFISYALIPTVIRLMPASAFLNFYTVQVSDAQIGTNPQLTLCRTTSFGSVKIDAVRTFLLVKTNGKVEEVAEYQFKANINDDKGKQPCAQVELTKQPQKVGTYKLRTEVTFFVNNIEKRSTYTSNDYKMLNTIDAIKKEIEEQQNRIKELELQLSQFGQKSSGSARSSGSTTSGGQAPSQPTGGNNGNGNGGGNGGGGGNGNGNNDNPTPKNNGGLLGLCPVTNPLPVLGGVLAPVVGCDN